MSKPVIAEEFTRYADQHRADAHLDRAKVLEQLAATVANVPNDLVDTVNQLREESDADKTWRDMMRNAHRPSYRQFKTPATTATEFCRRFVALMVDDVR
jgi:hypothetical protein